MPDLSNDIRLAVDSGSTALGIRSVLKSVKTNKAKLIIAASKNKAENISNIKHLAGVSGINFTEFSGTPVDLGTLCGKPFSVSVLSIIDPGHSKILENFKVGE